MREGERERERKRERDTERERQGQRQKERRMDRPPELQRLLEADQLLGQYQEDLLQRWRRYSNWQQRVAEAEGSLAEFALGYKDWGIVQRPGGEVTVREWVEAAEQVALVGEFNGWDTTRHVCHRDQFGVFSLTVAAREDGSPAVPHGSQVKLWVRSKSGQEFFRLSPWTKYATQVGLAGMGERVCVHTLLHICLLTDIRSYTRRYSHSPTLGYGRVNGLQGYPLGPTHSLPVAAWASQAAIQPQDLRGPHWNLLS